MSDPFNKYFLSPVLLILPNADRESLGLTGFTNTKDNSTQLFSSGPIRGYSKGKN
jgi:hypothetical protein